MMRANPLFNYAERGNSDPVGGSIRYDISSRLPQRLQTKSLAKLSMD